jgi:hypothetical protein
MRAELEDAAASNGCGLSGLIRKVLIDFCAKRSTDRAV